MNWRLGEAAIFAAGLTYLVVLALAMIRLSFDIWGALVVIPVYGVLGVAGMRRMFRGHAEQVATVMCWGLLVKLGGAFARYWVGFEAYGGGIDAGEYHRYGTAKAGAIWDGEISRFEIIPTGSGTHFLENVTATVYTLTGGSQLAGFVTFSFMAYWGVAFMVKAAAVAVPGISIRKYAWLCVLAPSVVYWPSSIGKEAVMMLGLGIAAYGVAVMLARHRSVLAPILIAASLGVSSILRPHMAGIWVAAALPALILAIVARERADRRHGGGRIRLAIVVVAAGVGLAALASATVEFLAPYVDDSGTASLTEIFEETTRRTAQAGSQFTPPPIAGPTDWPYAVVRTLTRPLPLEARGIAQLISSAEIVALMLLYAVSWRRVRTLPGALIRHPYVTFCVLAVILSGLAYSVFANLGVLARQKSLIVPFLLLPPCLPLVVRERRVSGAPGSIRAQTEELATAAPTSGEPAGDPARPPVAIAPRPQDDRIAVFDDIWT